MVAGPSQNFFCTLTAQSDELVRCDIFDLVVLGRLIRCRGELHPIVVVMGVVVLAFCTTFGQTIRTFISDNVVMPFHPLPLNVLLFHDVCHKFLYTLRRVLIRVCHPVTSRNRGRVFAVITDCDWALLVPCSSQDQGMSNCRDFCSVVRMTTSPQEVPSILLQLYRPAHDVICWHCVFFNVVHQRSFNLPCFIGHNSPTCN